MASYCEKEFNVKNFGFTHSRPQLFVLPQFGPNILYPIWTVFVLLYHVTILAVDAYITIDKFGEARAHFFLYFTSWSYLLLAIYSLVDCITTLHVHCHAKHLLEQRESYNNDVAVTMKNKTVDISYKTYGKTYETPCYLKLTWVLFTTSGVVGFAVTLVYWVVYAMANIIGGDWQEDQIFVDVCEFGSITFHIANAVMIFLHIIISAKPSRILHCYIPMIFCVLYAIFNAVYQVITDKFIYNSLDWDNTFISIAAVAGGILILIPIVHMCVHGLILVRTALGEWCQIKFAVKSYDKQHQMNRVHPGDRRIGADF